MILIRNKYTFLKGVETYIDFVGERVLGLCIIFIGKPILIECERSQYMNGQIVYSGKIPIMHHI